MQNTVRGHCTHWIQKTTHLYILADSFTEYAQSKVRNEPFLDTRIPPQVHKIQGSLSWYTIGKGRKARKMKPNLLLTSLQSDMKKWSNKLLYSQAADSKHSKASKHKITFYLE